MQARYKRRFRTKGTVPIVSRALHRYNNLEVIVGAGRQNVLAAATVDRMTHKSHSIDTKASSYRLK